MNVWSHTYYLRSCGLRESSADLCMFFIQDLVLFFYVDDGLSVGGVVEFNFTNAPMNFV